MLETLLTYFVVLFVCVCGHMDGKIICIWTVCICVCVHVDVLMER